MSSINIYTDGACKGNPGKGGWCAILLWKDKKKKISGKKKHTTNQEMELHAIAEGLKALKSKDIPVEIYTDSQYAINGATKWIKGWQLNNWKNAAKKPVKHQELWQEIWRHTQDLQVSWFWVKGHSGDPLNEEADDEASFQAMQF